jgi:hypothetical protein
MPAAIAGTNQTGAEMLNRLLITAFETTRQSSSTNSFLLEILCELRYSK